MQNVCKLIEDLYIAYKEANIWITGDFNLPNIDLITNSVVDNAYPLDICNLLINAFIIWEASCRWLTHPLEITIYWTSLQLTDHL